VDFRTDDVTRLRGIAGPFDLALDIGCLHGLTKERKTIYVANLERLLRPQGTFLLYGFIAQDDDMQGSGLTPTDLELIASRLRLVQRVDGADRGTKPSAWLTYQR
jgi:cyclopropane fatty-acyl-phospholipid synthase-like methyltransferase